jgi:hypothetical protein
MLLGSWDLARTKKFPASCIFAYGIPADYADEYLRIRWNTSVVSAL